MEIKIEHKKDLIKHEVSQVNISLSLDAEDVAEGAKHAGLQAADMIRRLGPDDAKAEKVKIAITVNRKETDQTAKLGDPA